MAEKQTAARPYAEAVFELAHARDQLKRWSEMLALAAAVARDATMVRLAYDPKVPRERLSEIFLGVCGGEMTAEAGNFVRLLIENRRLALLPEIVLLYEELRGAAEGTVEAQVVSAFPLTEAQSRAITAGLTQRLGREVKLSASVDQALVGGVVIRAGDLVIDGSVRGKLARLTSQLTQ